MVVAPQRTQKLQVDWTDRLDPNQFSFSNLQR